MYRVYYISLINMKKFLNPRALHFVLCSLVGYAPHSCMFHVHFATASHSIPSTRTVILLQSFHVRLTCDNEEGYNLLSACLGLVVMMFSFVTVYAWKMNEIFLHISILLLVSHLAFGIMGKIAYLLS
ncbi:hypothetical protein ACJX0J_013984 [Zea mays]